MVTLTKQQVPSYLVGSDFYNSLSVDEEDEFTIPNEYFKSTTSVSNAEELSNLMHTIHFWGLKKLPNEIIELLVFKSVVFTEAERVKVCKVLLALGVDFDLLELYLNFPVCVTREQRLNAAVRSGSRIVLDYVYTVDKQVNAAIVEAAAENGHLRLLERVMQELEKSLIINNPFKHVSLGTVASRGHVNCLRYLLDKGCVMDMAVGRAAAKSGQLKCLQLARERGYTFDNDILRAVAFHGHLECLVYVLHHGCVATSGAASYAAFGRQVDCLEYLLDQGVPLAKAMCNAAASSGSLACLQLLRARGCPWDEECARIASKRGNLSCLKYIVSQGGVVDQCAAYYAAANGQHFCLEYLLEVGCVVGSECVREAAARGQVHCLYILRRFEVPSDRSHVVEAMRPKRDRTHAPLKLRGESYIHALFRAGYALPQEAVEFAIVVSDIRSLKFICANHCCELTTHHAAHAASKPNAEVLLEVLHQYDCPWDVHTCINAASAVTDSVLAFAHTHGCPWDERVSEAAALSGDAAALRYCVEHGCPMTKATMEEYNKNRLNISSEDRFKSHHYWEPDVEKSW